MALQPALNPSPNGFNAGYNAMINLYLLDQQLYSLNFKSLFTYSDVLCQPFPAPGSRMCLSLYICYER